MNFISYASHLVSVEDIETINVNKNLHSFLNHTFPAHEGHFIYLNPA